MAGDRLFRLELERGTLMARLNRFLLSAEIGGRKELVLLRNTGRLPELRPGSEILLVRVGKKDGRKTSATMLGAIVSGRVVLLDPPTQCAAFEAAVERGLIPWMGGWSLVGKEVRVGDSRLDYAIGLGRARGYLETKSAGQLDGDFATYPDCPTDRGVKHIAALATIAERGTRTAVAFIATHPDGSAFRPNRSSDPRVGDGLMRASRLGTEVRCVKIVMDVDGWVRLDRPEVKVVLGL